MKARTLLGGTFAALLIGPSAVSAQAVQLRDFFVEFGTTIRIVSPGLPPRDSQATTRFTAIAGTMLSYVNGWGDSCGNSVLAIVYKPGVFADTVGCAPERTGTSVSYNETSTTAKFQTNLAVSGNLITLRGKMTGRTTQNSSDCGKKSGKEKAFEITETLRLRVVGKACQVIEYTRVHVRTERDTHRDDGRALESEYFTITDRVAPGARCVFTVASEQPVMPPAPGMVGLPPARCN